MTNFLEIEAKAHLKIQWQTCFTSKHKIYKRLVLKSYYNEEEMNLEKYHLEIQQEQCRESVLTKMRPSRFYVWKLINHYLPTITMNEKLLSFTSKLIKGYPVQGQAKNQPTDVPTFVQFGILSQI